MADPCDLSAVELTNGLHRGDLGALEVLDAFIARIEHHNPLVNAFVTLDLARARETARRIDQTRKARPSRPLLGLPVAVKDIFPTRGMRTTFGSTTFTRNVPTEDAAHVARLRAAGAIIIGKTNTPEFAVGGQTLSPVAGLTRNPHNPAKTVAGSSGGSAAALAAGMTALADGSDLGGSLRAPASWCGVVGFRPSAGVVPFAPGGLPAEALHVAGPMARNVKDAALLMSVVAGRHSCSLWSVGAPEIDFHSALNPENSGRRLAWCMRPGGATTSEAVVRALARHEQTLMDLGCELAHACPDLGQLHEAHAVFRCLNIAIETAHLKDCLAAEPDSELHRSIEAANRISGADLAAAKCAQATAWRSVCRFFEIYDFLIWPVTTGLAYDAELPGDQIPEDWRPVELTPCLNLPAISVPAGLTTDGMPVGLQILGPPYSDMRLLNLAFAFEQAATA